MTDQTHMPSTVEDLAVSSRWIYHLLTESDDGQLTVQEIQSETGLSVNGIRKAVTRLEDRDVVESRWATHDARQRLIKLSE